MAYTVQQKRLVDRVCDVLVQQREALRITVVALKTELDTFNGPALVLNKAQSYANVNLGGVLTKLNNNSAEILTAAGLVGVSDFSARWTQLNDGKNALANATVGNIGTRLQQVIDALSVETIL